MEVKKILKDQNGGAAIWITAVAFFLLVFIALGCEYMRLQIISENARNVVENAITQVCTNNYNKLYNGLREGYSGGYTLNKGSWSEDIDPGDLYSLLDKQLGMQADGSGHARYISNNMEFRISDLSVQMTNTPFAPDKPQKEPTFKGVAKFTLTVPLSFGWQSLPPMTNPMEVEAGYTAKF